MRYLWFALMVGMLTCAPFVGGCSKAKKEEPSGKEMATPTKTKNPRAVQPPEPPP